MSGRLSEADALAQLRATSDAIVAGIESLLPAWTEHQVRRILDAWARVDAATRARAEAEAFAAGPRVAVRVGAELRALFALDPEAMRVTPLEVVRTAVREPTAILESAGVPPVERDEFAERSWPSDHYGLTPATLGDLTDTDGEPGAGEHAAADLGPLQLAWGSAKVAVLRARRATRPGDTRPHDHVG